MPKLKNRSSLKGRIKISATGKVLVHKMTKRHNLDKKGPKRIRQDRQQICLDSSFAKILKKMVPYRNKKSASN